MVDRTFLDYSGVNIVELATGTGAAGANTTVLQAALSGGGGVLLPKPGTFYVNATLLIPSNTVLSAVSPGTIIRAVPGMNAAVLKNAGHAGAGNTDIHVSGIVFDGDAPNQTVAFSTADFNLVTNFSFDRCRFNRALRTGTFPSVSSDGEGLVLRLCQDGTVSRCKAENNVYDGFKTRGSKDVFFTDNIGNENGRSGIQISYQGTVATPSERVHVNGFIMRHSTGVATAASPTVSGVYLHTANFCNVQGVTVDGARQGIGVYEQSNDNLFSDLILRTRFTTGGADWSAIAVGDSTGTGFCNRNRFNTVHIRPISGANGEYVRLFGNAGFNSFRDVWASAGGGSGTWTINIPSGANSNQFSDGLLANYSLANAGTGNVFDNWTSI